MAKKNLTIIIILIIVLLGGYLVYSNLAGVRNLDTGKLKSMVMGIIFVQFSSSPTPTPAAIPSSPPSVLSSPTPTPSLSPTRTPASTPSPSLSPSPSPSTPPSPSPSPKTCLEVFGEGNYALCPLTETDAAQVDIPGFLDAWKAGQVCCDSRTEMCCHDYKKGAPVCCPKENFRCAVVEYLKGAFKVNTCDVQKCPPDLPVPCPDEPDAIGERCCPKGSGCKIAPPVIGGPVCTQKTKCNEKTEITCATFGILKKEYLCCDKATEKCINVWRYPICVKTKCKDSEHLCEGKGAFEGKYNVCCAEDTTCFWGPSGFPKCVKKPSASPVIFLEVFLKDAESLIKRIETAIQQIKNMLMQF